MQAQAQVAEGHRIMSSVSISQGSGGCRILWWRYLTIDRNLGLEYRREWVKASNGDLGTTGIYTGVQVLMFDPGGRQVEWRKEEG